MGGYGVGYFIFIFCADFPDSAEWMKRKKKLPPD
jgi:hypothetical protein